MNNDLDKVLSMIIKLNKVKNYDKEIEICKDLIKKSK